MAANTFRETVRERVLYNLMFFALLMTASSLLLGQLSIHQDEKIVKDLGLASVDIFGTLIAVFIGVGLIGKEIERRSLYPLLAKPLRRHEFLLGKFAGLAFTLLVNTALMSAGLFATLLLRYRRADLELLKGVVALYLGLLLVVAVALFFSTVATSTLVATLSTLAMVVAGRYGDVIRNMRDVTNVPQWLVTGLYLALPNFHNFDVKTEIVYGDPVPAVQLAWMAAYAAAYAGALLSAAQLAFARRDLT
ncbi:MAG TPA: ABC transporter permease [Vicinamibacteria bacterium]|nr:ABC transporter permease [Vicinamibacteria bacterium]